jgi:hypothetical protein
MFHISRAGAPASSGARLAGAFTALALAAGGTILAPATARAQDLPEFELDGLLRTGLRIESARYEGASGFEIFDARLGLSGKVGIVFDYALRAEYQFDDDAVRLLDARLSFPLRDELLRLDVGLLMSGFGREAMKQKELLPLVERSQGSLALAPGRQVGAALKGEAFEQRLRYWGGLYNGEGARFGNDDRGFLFSTRAQYNSVGEVEFFEDFVYEFGADLAFASDSANEVLPVSRPAGFEDEPGATIPGYAEYTGNRFVWSADAGLRYRSWSLAAEYGRAEYDPADDSEKVSSEAWFVEGAYSLWGAFDLLLRYDSFLPAAGIGTEPGRYEFLVFGFNLNPGFHARIGLQYAVGMGDSMVGVSEAIDGTNTGPALADNQFLLNLQVAF